MKGLAVFMLILCVSACGLTKKPSAISPNEDLLLDAREDTAETAAATFKKAVEQVQKNYYEEVSPRKLTNWAIYGMVSRLNSHSGFVWAEPEKCEPPPEEESFGFAFTTMNDRFTHVTRVSHPSTAFEEDVRVGDKILAVNGISVQGHSSTEISNILICSKSPVNISLLRGNNGITRRVGRAPNESVRTHTASLPGHVGYLYLTSLNSPLSGKAALLEFLKLRDSGHSRFILDLRGMSGGYLQEGMDFLSLLLPPETLVGRCTVRKEEYKTPALLQAIDGTVVVLVNRYTNSLGEIMTMALKSYRRVTVIGETTRGHGTITLTPLSVAEDSYMSLPVGLVYGPRGETFDGRGVNPDIFVRDENPVGYYVKGLPDPVLKAALRYLNQSF